MSNTNTTTEKLSTCNCAEVFIDDIVDVKQPDGKMKQETTKRRLPYSQYHNCEYVSKRNGYVAQAAIFAQGKLEEANHLKPESRSAAFNSIFSHKMEELCQHLTK